MPPIAGSSTQAAQYCHVVPPMWPCRLLGGMCVCVCVCVSECVCACVACLEVVTNVARSQASNGTAPCKACSPHCHTCATATTCAACQPGGGSSGYELSDGACTPCADNEYSPDGVSCVACGEGCESCTAAGVCTLCTAGISRQSYGLHNGACQQCTIDQVTVARSSRVWSATACSSPTASYDCRCQRALRHARNVVTPCLGASTARRHRCVSDARATFMTDGGA